MNILSIENSTPSLSIALKSSNKITEKNLIVSDKSENILPLIDGLLKKSGLDIKKIDLLCIGLGPGSFTGLRVAVSIAKGLHIAAGIPLLGLPSYSALGHEYKGLGKEVVVLFDARRSLIYGAVYTQRKGRVITKTKEKLSELDYFLRRFCSKNSVFLGESFRFSRQIQRIWPRAAIYKEITYPKARFLIEQAEEPCRKNKLTPPEKLDPVYLHPETCQIRKRKRKSDTSHS